MKIDLSRVSQKIDNIVSKKQYMLDARVAADSNFYCPQDVGTLQDSVILSNTFGKGYLIWNQTYAKAQYYSLPNKSKDKNPNARTKWFEHAKVAKLKEWVKI